MALTQIGDTNIYADKTLVAAKTVVEKINHLDIWHFQILIDGKWIDLQYDSESDANTEWATYS